MRGSKVEPDVGDEIAVLAGAGQQPRRSAAIELADIGMVGMAGDDGRDRRVELVEDRQDIARTGRRSPEVDSVSGSFPPWWISRTIVSAPCALSRGTSALAVSASSAKISPATPAGVTTVPVPFSVMPMKPIRDRAEVGGSRWRERASSRLPRAHWRRDIGISRP